MANPASEHILWPNQPGAYSVANPASVHILWPTQPRGIFCGQPSLGAYPVPNPASGHILWPTQPRGIFCGQPSLLFSEYLSFFSVARGGGGSGHRLILTSHLHLIPTISMSGGVSPLLLMLSSCV